MSWSEGNWTQNDLYYEGLPYITISGYANPPDMTNVKFIWAVPPTLQINNGLPYVAVPGYASVVDMTNVKFIWNQSQTNNFGLPYITYMENIGAFTNCTNLTSVVIPESVKYIDHYSFYNTSLTHVTIASDCVYYSTSFPPGCVIDFYSS